MVSSSKIKNFHAFPASGESDKSFVGLKFIKNEIYFYYPQTYSFDMDSPSIRNDIISILKTFTLLIPRNKDKGEVNNIYNYGCLYALDSYLWIINDFLANGFYKNRSKFIKINGNGRVNWKKTLRNQPIISKGNVIYSDIVTESSKLTESILVEIHKFCIKKSIDYIGWLFNLNSNFIEESIFNEEIKKIYLNTLNQELDQTFEDSKKELLIHCRNIILGLDDSSNDKDFTIGIDDYYHVFEKMVDNVFGTATNKAFYYPRSKWGLVKNGLVEIDGDELYPDTILEARNNAYILDSKYYRFGLNGDENYLPGPSDVQKQIAYGEYLKNDKKFSFSKVYNAFLMPFNKNDGIFKTSSNLVYVGYARSEAASCKESFHYIYTFLIDLRYLINIWNKGFSKKDSDELIDLIDKNKII